MEAEERKLIVLVGKDMEGTGNIESVPHCCLVGGHLGCNCFFLVVHR